MLGIIERSGLPDTGAAASIASCPEKPFFLQENYIRKYWKMAELPAEKLEYTLDFAAKIRKDLRYRQLTWHLYRYFTLTPMANVEHIKLTDNIGTLGVESGMIYLLTALTTKLLVTKALLKTL